MISASTWIRKGAAKKVPDKFELTEEAYQEIMSRVEIETKDARAGLAEAKKNKKVKKPTVDIDEEMAKFNLEGYSNESDVDLEGDAIDLFSLSALAPENREEEEREEPEDKEDIEITGSDSLLVTCRTEDEVSYLEVNLYEEDEDNLYVHHDLMLPTFPLCLEWIGCGMKKDGGEVVGNYCAVGTFDPEIEIWNLDVLDVAYPAAILGRNNIKNLNKNSKNDSKNKNHYHCDAVMTLSWNKQHGNMLISGSADKTVKLWDLYNPAHAIRSFNHHDDKVQSVQWNPFKSTMIASASYDKWLMLFDCRSPQDQIKIGLGSDDPEMVRWNPHTEGQVAVTDESGLARLFDIRNTISPLFSLQAHQKSTTCFDWNPLIPDCFLTASVDRSFKIWNIQSDNSPTCVISREPGAGKIFTASFCPDVPWILGYAGSRGEAAVLNLANNDAFMDTFRDRIIQ